MPERFRHAEIEPEWQAAWEEQGPYDTVEVNGNAKWYPLILLPYTSGDLHTGHWYAITPSDATARYIRMSGYNFPSQPALTPSAYQPKTLQFKTTSILRRGYTTTSSACRASCAAWAPSGPGTAMPSAVTRKTTNGPNGSSSGCKKWD